MFFNILYSGVCGIFVFILWCTFFFNPDIVVDNDKFHRIAQFVIAFGIYSIAIQFYTWNQLYKKRHNIKDDE